MYAFSRLPKLENLLLADNGLTEVWAETPSDTNNPRPFPALEQLSLTGNPLAALWCVDALDALPCLTTLRLGNADLVGTARGGDSGGGGPPGPAEVRQLLIARLPKLRMLNGSEVRQREREDAEKAHTRRVGAAFASGRGAATGPTAIFGTRAATSQSAAIAAFYGGGGGGGGGAGDLPIGAAEARGGGKEVIPLAFRKAGDGGVIRARTAEEGRGTPSESPFPLFLLSSGAVAAYETALDPAGLGATAPAEAAALQALHPRYFALAARYDLHAAAAVEAAAHATTLAGSAVGLTLRSLAGDSCMSDPLVRKLPVSMTVGG